METVPEDVKDPLTEKHLKIMFQYVNVKNEVCVLFCTMIIFLFRTLLMVGHMVMSPPCIPFVGQMWIFLSGDY